MESLGVIFYDREQDLVELLPAAHNFDVYMETVEKEDIPWSYFYVGLSTLDFAGSIVIVTVFLNGFQVPDGYFL